MSGSFPIAAPLPARPKRCENCSRRRQSREHGSKLAAQLFQRLHVGLSHQIPGASPRSKRSDGRIRARPIRPGSSCRSGRPRETGKLEDIADLRLMPLLVKCDDAQQLQHIVDAHQRMLVNHYMIVERWVRRK
jgi:hypothetical protein